MEVRALGIGEEIGGGAARLGRVERQGAEFRVRAQRLGDAGDRGAGLRVRVCVEPAGEDADAQPARSP